MKGVLSVHLSGEKLVFQAVHTVFNSEFDEEWSHDEDRTNKMVFIGKNLDKELLEKQFDNCILTKAQQEKRLAELALGLRFKIGTKVKCQVDDNVWAKGDVVDQCYSDETMTPGFVAPYQVELEDGNLIWVPEDDNSFIKKVI